MTSSTPLSSQSPGLSFSAVTLDDGADSFWRILDGDDTFTGPLLANMAAGAASKIFGDGINARAGVSSGGNDVFDTGDTNVTVYGDVVNVGSQTPGAPSVIYTGGNDIIDGRATASRPLLVGDAGFVNASGRLIGGDDTITMRATAILPEAFGDALLVSGVAGNLAELIGGDDTIDASLMLVGTADFGASIIGDVANLGAFASMTGGNDTMFGSAGEDNLTGDAGNNASDVTGGADEMHGNDGDDNIVGEVFNASGTIYGGDDLMYGGNGADRMFGEFANGVGIVLFGGNDELYGGAGADFMRGQSGNDLMDGGTGADAMEGGTGSDTYFVDDAGDTTEESVNGGGAADVVYSTVSFTAAAGIEQLILLGFSDINATGRDGQNDNLTGNFGNNILVGRTGADTMAGGLGDDRYYVDNLLDVVSELAGGGSGDDFIFSSVSFTSALNAERLYLTGTANINGTGRDGQADIIYGNAGGNILDGKTGSDTLSGGLGDDQYFVNTSGDAVGRGGRRGL